MSSPARYAEGASAAQPRQLTPAVTVQATSLAPTSAADLHHSRASHGREAFGRDGVSRRALGVSDMLAAAAGLTVLGSLSSTGFDPLWLITVPAIVVLAKMLGRYDRDAVVLRRSTLDEFPALLALAAAYAVSWSMLAGVLARHLHPASSRSGLLWAATVVALTVCRTLARWLVKLCSPPERVLIVGSARSRNRLADALVTDPSTRLDVVGFLPIEDERQASHNDFRGDRRRRSVGFDDLARIVHEDAIDRVMLVSGQIANETMVEAISRTNAIGVKVSLVPDLMEVVGSAVEFDSVGGVFVLGLRPPGLGRSSRAVKRAMDLVGAGVGVALLAPLGLLTALAIKLDTPGPVFFRQARVGRDGRVFRMFKFRSMVIGAEAQREQLQSMNETEGLFKLTSDPRVTRIGQLLRKTSVDEMPQLLNVLLGDMSLVGPRPLVLDEDRLVEGRHRSRLALPPGMTGPWQVLGPTRPPLSEMVKTDYLYAANWSLWTDIKILLRTFAHVAAGRGL